MRLLSNFSVAFQVRLRLSVGYYWGIGTTDTSNKCITQRYLHKGIGRVKRASKRSPRHRRRESVAGGRASLEAPRNGRVLLHRTVRFSSFPLSLLHKRITMRRLKYVSHEFSQLSRSRQTCIFQRRYPRTNILCLCDCRGTLLTRVYHNHRNLSFYDRCLVTVVVFELAQERARG